MFDIKATIDESGCIGCGLCAEICPEVFAMCDDGLAKVIANPTAKTFDTAKEAAGICPVAVIAIDE